MTPHRFACLLAAALAGCSGQSDPPAQVSVPAPAPATTAAATAAQTVAEAPVSYPILFVTQVPVHTDMAGRLSAFANHLTGVQRVPRGGDLWLRYPDGRLRNLTREAGFGHAGLQDGRSIAVREPAVDWSGGKAVFSMLVGASGGTWQIYEVTGLGPKDKARIVRVPTQPAGYNNVSPLYASDGRILFTSDRPRGGEAHLYPQLDEYEATPTTTGIWSLDPASGQLRLLTHTPSGAFSPIVDSYGRIVFTRWDHQQQDQLAQRDRDAQHNGVALPFKSFNYAGEAASDPATTSRDEPFPESRAGSTGPYGDVSAFATNFFTAWTINQDGTGEETLNHVGQHELSFGYLTPSFKNDPALTSRTLDTLHANQLSIRREGGLFHLREDPRQPGTYFGTAARESGSFTTAQIVRLTGAPQLNGEQMTLTSVTEPSPSDLYQGGRFRNPLPLSDGALIASHTRSIGPVDQGGTLDGLRLVRLERDAATGRYRAGAPLTSGLRKSVRWPSPSGMQAYSGDLWELEAVEVRPRRAPDRHEGPLEAPERAVLAEEGVDEAALRAWLTRRELALVVTRDQTTRDRADRQQPYNLRVPGGVQTLANGASGGRVYDIAHFQLFEAEQLRAYPDRPGRRVLAEPLRDIAKVPNPPNPAGPPGSVRIAADGSTAAFVPARRALTWQTTDPRGTAIVRERNWITFQPGEMRTCASCHGVNSVTQAGLPPPVNKPEALRQLLRYWKNNLNP